MGRVGCVGWLVRAVEACPRCWMRCPGGVWWRGFLIFQLNRVNLSKAGGKVAPFGVA